MFHVHHDIYRGVQRFHNHVIIQRLADTGLLDKQRNTAESGLCIVGVGGCDPARMSGIQRVNVIPCCIIPKLCHPDRRTAYKPFRDADQTQFRERPLKLQCARYKVLPEAGSG